jgi:ABC-type branched-subunit amino acid transport system ATPase component/ABC-type branched-subunit amino acid transport system permease subunit
MLLSIVVLTGYAGQVSLAQYALGGTGAFAAGKLIASEGWPAWAAIIAGTACAVVVGVLFGLPALRTRGVNLAVLTLGLGLALQSLLFNNAQYTGGIIGTNVGPLHVFGIDLDPIVYPDRFAIFVLAVFGVCALAVSNIRRGRAGRRMIAVRSNERAAASLGINVVSAKLYAFAIASGLAGLSGILLGLSAYTIVFTNYDPISSIYAVTLSVIGGVGYISGALFGSTLSSNGIGSLIGNAIFGTNVGNWLTLGGGLTLLVLLIRDPDGIASANAKSLKKMSEMVKTRFTHARRPVETDKVGALSEGIAESDFKATPRTLTVEGATVRFGGVQALTDVSVAVRPGEVVGVIGPNGAGKTTLIDAITGFVNMSDGTVRVEGTMIDHWGTSRRARSGITRSFQSLELFEDLTVRENLLAGSDPRDMLAYLSNLVWPGKRTLTPAAIAAVRQFSLADDLERMAIELPFGRRRLVGIARAIATGASVILLDEPGAGLDDIERNELAGVIRHMTDVWKMSVLLVEHDMSLVMKTCDRILVLDGGCLLSEGTPDVIRNDDRVVAVYLGDDTGDYGETDSSRRQEVALRADV